MWHQVTAPNKGMLLNCSLSIPRVNTAGNSSPKTASKSSALRPGPADLARGHRHRGVPRVGPAGRQGCGQALSQRLRGGQRRGVQQLHQLRGRAHRGAARCAVTQQERRQLRLQRQTESVSRTLDAETTTQASLLHGQLRLQHWKGCWHAQLKSGLYKPGSYFCRGRDNLWSD